jgi:hypothetical protein
MFRAQSHLDKRLVIVENGAAIGGCAERGIVPDLLTTSEPHVSHARNAGIHAVREQGGGFVSMWNDDDWYGPWYVAEQVENAHRATVVGKRPHFVHLDGDGLYLFRAPRAWCAARKLFGPTLGFHAEEVCDFPVTDQAEEYEWAQHMRQQGATLFSLSLHHFLYMRRAVGHTWQADFDLVRASFAGSDPVYYLGPEVLPAVVAGYAPWHLHVQYTIDPEQRAAPIEYDVQPCPSVPLTVLPGDPSPLPAPTRLPFALDVLSPY